MRLDAACPQCSAPLAGSGSSWACPLHAATPPLWRVVEPGYDAFAEHLLLSRPLPTWLPWPLPPAWQVTDFGCVAAEGLSPQAAFVTCSGPSPDDGVVEVTVLTEEPGVGLGARCAQVTHTDPGREAVDGAPPVWLRVDGATVPMWTVPMWTVPTATVPTRREPDLPTVEPDPLVLGMDQPLLDRTVLVGEAEGRWLWVVLRPASAALLLQPRLHLHDVSALGPELLELPFGAQPRAW